MASRFNLVRYKELLKLEENGKISFMSETFLEFQISIEYQIAYNRKKSYFSLIDKYLSRIISLEEFRSNFAEMEEEDSAASKLILHDFQKLEVFLLADDLARFSEFMACISMVCSDYNKLSEPMPENDFYHVVSIYCLQFQNVFPVPFSRILSSFRF